ncbi:vWA domain-containing protein [Actinomadura scrupuli]|uniref:vWA domain-containing protein n=1 Tax=Actinomadura scrupuli TaxID=559629 RepID=UPI003D951273
MRSARRLTALIGAVLVGVTVAPVQTLAATPQAGSAAGPGELAPIMLVLDASGSMTAPAPGGTKMDAAKRAVRSVVNTVPANSRLGLTVYGTGTGPSAGEKAAGCKDITVVHPVGPLDKAGIVRAANAVKPRGYTPIGQALRTAAAAPPKEGPRSIVLVSDGEDTCAPPAPCDVAKELAQQGVNLRIHTVGYQVDPKARDQLTCIAQSSGGTYTNVPDASSLGRALGRVTASALRNYEPAGTPVTGSDTLQGAPVLTPGAYQDTLGPIKRYYSVDVPAGNTVYISATVPFTGGHDSLDGTGLTIGVKGLNGTDCNYANGEFAIHGQDSRPLSVELTWDGLASKTRTPIPDCRNPGRYTFEVYFTQGPGMPGADGAARPPIELQVGLEPPVTGDKGPEPARQFVAFQNPGGPDRPVAGGASFGTAAALPGSGHYTEQIRYGEWLFYRVRLDWGQALTYRVRYPADPNNKTSVDIRSEMYTPSRKTLGWETTYYAGQAKTLDAPYLYPKTGGFSSPPIRYRNRELTDQKLNPYSVAGWYYFAVKLGTHADGGDPPNAIPVTMDVAVVGTPEKGPQYAGAAAGTDAFGASPTTRSNPSARTPLATRNVSAESGKPWWIIGAAAGVLAVGTLIGTLLYARRRRPQPPSFPGAGTPPYFPGPGGPPGPPR